MHEGGALSWREVVDKHHFALLDELSVRVETDLREAVSRAIAAERSQAAAQASAAIELACREARRSQVESLNQFLRRLRTAAEEHILDLLAESCSAYAPRLVVLVFESNQAKCAATRGIDGGAIAAFDTDSAPAIAAAIGSRDPVIALANDAEISPVLAQAFKTPPDATAPNQTAPDRKAYLFPVIARHSVVAMLIASDLEVSAPVELLCEAAGMRLETSSRPTADIPAGDTLGPRAWDDLSLDDQRLHLQAQRMARVRVAELRLYHENELRAGAAAGNIYGALQTEVDRARDQFLQTFLSKSPTMVDYLHLEILRTLAHDDERALGNAYPGPMV